MSMFRPVVAFFTAIPRADKASSAQHTAGTCSDTQRRETHAPAAFAPPARSPPEAIEVWMGQDNEVEVADLATLQRLDQSFCPFWRSPSTSMKRFRR